jgi:hypothetical protein
MCLGLAACIVLPPTGLSAQAALPSSAGDEGVDAPAVPERDGISFLGHAPDRRRLIPGFFRTHPFDQRFPELAWTTGMGVQASMWFGGAFINSYDDFSLIAGIERSWLERRGETLGYGLGYRAGFITGYDEQLVRWADDVPAVPFAGMLLWMQVGRVGFEAFYVYRVITIGSTLRF